MGFCNFFSAKLPKISDSFFGEMLFIKGGNSAKSYFEGRRNFKPIGENIELSIDGNLEGPTQRQKDFFRQLEADYCSLIPVFISSIEAEFGHWLKLPVIMDFQTELKPVFLSLSDCEQPPIAWEIVFDTVHDLSHTVTIGMLGNEPRYVRIDG